MTAVLVFCLVVCAGWWAWCLWEGYQERRKWAEFDATRTREQVLGQEDLDEEDA